VDPPFVLPPLDPPFVLPPLLPTPPFGLPSLPVDVETTTPLSSVVCTVVSLTVPVPLPLWTVILGPPPVDVVGCASVGLAKIMVQRAIEKKRFMNTPLVSTDAGSLSVHCVK
jgi:hypothetical protein